MSDDCIHGEPWQECPDCAKGYPPERPTTVAQRPVAFVQDEDGWTFILFNPNDVDRHDEEGYVFSVVDSALLDDLAAVHDRLSAARDAIFDAAGYDPVEHRLLRPCGNWMSEWPDGYCCVCGWEQDDHP